MASRPTSSHKPSLDALEDRDLPALHLMASLSGGLLRIEGTENDDSIVVRHINDYLSIDSTLIDVEGEGEKAKVSSSDVDRVQIRGLGGDDSIWLHLDEENQSHLNGNIVVWAGTGDDQISGSELADQIFGQAGNDILFGNGGDDLLFGDSGDDQIFGGNGNDAISGGTRNDLLRGGEGDDFLRGGSGNDVLKGGSGDDRLEGGAGINLLQGYDGDDTIRSSSPGDRLDGGHGTDRAVLSYSKAIAPTSYGIEHWGSGGVAKKEAAPPPKVTPKPLPAPEAPSSSTASHSPAAPAPQVKKAPSLFAGAFREDAREIFQLLNEYREENGFTTLTANRDLMEAAQYQADYMARTEHYSHVNLDGRTLADRVDAAGYRYWWIAENAHKYDPSNRRTMGLDRVYPESELAHYYLDGWKLSPGHNSSMLSSRAAEVGVALARSSSGNIYAVQVFGDPR